MIEDLGIGSLSQTLLKQRAAMMMAILKQKQVPSRLARLSFIVRSLHFTLQGRSVGKPG
jgi:hypothetical protein